jgi:tRNA-specific 2-thiouridylase
MSGGVDSSVAAALLVEAGLDVVGVTLSLWEDEDPCAPEGGCCTPQDLLDAKRVCATLGVPHFLLNWRARFEADVIQPFVTAWTRGETPNPCVACNNRIKFTHLLAKTRDLGARWLATGHYARVDVDDSLRPRLRRGRDPQRDQSYFLAGMGTDALTHLVLPVGDLDKDEVRAHARRFSLLTAGKPDSQDICFVPGGDLAAFFGRRGLPTRPGLILDEHGRNVGTHQGVHLHTIGQRRGLGVAGAARRYVTGIDAAEGIVRLGPAEELQHVRVPVTGLSWLLPDGGADPLWLQVRSRGQPRRVRSIQAGASGHLVEVTDAILAPAPGQAAVLYGGPGGDIVCAAATVARAAPG